MMDLGGATAGAANDARAGRVAMAMEQAGVPMDRDIDPVFYDQFGIKDHAPVIAWLLGLESRRYVQGNEIIDLARGQDTSDIARGDLIQLLPRRLDN